MTFALTSLSDIERAGAQIRGTVVRSPLIDVSRQSGRPLWLKAENLQVAGLFKIRGAYNMIAGLTVDFRQRGVITYSSGNHGHAVAYAARRLGVPAVVVMSFTSPDVKIAGARRFGAEVLTEGTTSVERKARAEHEAHVRGLVVVPPFDHSDIIAGQATVGSEILEDCQGVNGVYVPIGGGCGEAGPSGRPGHRCGTRGRSDHDRIARSRPAGGTRDGEQRGRWSSSHTSRRPYVRTCSGIPRCGRHGIGRCDRARRRLAVSPRQARRGTQRRRERGCGARHISGEPRCPNRGRGQWRKHFGICTQCDCLKGRARDFGGGLGRSLLDAVVDKRPRSCHRLVERSHVAVELSLVDLTENLTHSGAWIQSKLEDVSPE